jgi:hypothetical protein
MHSILRRGAEALLLAAVLAGCGGGDDSAPATTTAPVMAPALLRSGPAYPISLSAWKAPASALPTSGNYVYLASEGTDYIGGGLTYIYNDKTAVMGVIGSGRSVSFSVGGDQSWSGQIIVPNTLPGLTVGQFKNLTRAPFSDPAIGGLEWSGEGRGCNTLKGWAIIDKVTIVNDVVTEIDARFEQHCEGAVAALRGQIHWTKANADAARPDGPQPIPSTLWRADPASVPAAGNYVYLNSTPGDYIGQGLSYLYTTATANLSIRPATGGVGISVSGDENWGGDFQAMSGVSQLQVGYYANLTRFPFHNTLKGGLNWSGEGRGCNTLTGWFVVDAVTYTGTQLTAIDLRFEQHCEGGAAALHGQIRWRADEVPAVPGPVNPPPANLWRPNFVPPAGNYVYLVSDAGDYIGQGKTQLFSSANSTIVPQLNLTAGFGLSVGGFYGTFAGMQTLTQLKPGYYGDLQRYPFHNPAIGGLSFSGNGRGCNTLTGWFVVDNVTYELGAVKSIDLRFEQHCEGGGPALRGVIHWAG